MRIFLAIILMACSSVLLKAEENLPSLAGRGPHHRTWQRIREKVRADGRVQSTTNSYVELGTGICYQRDLGQGKVEWLDSREEVVLVPGGAEASQGQHVCFFSANLNTAGAISLRTPDDKHLMSHVLGAGYFSPNTGKSVLLGQIKDSIGEVVPPNQVIYRDVFEGAVKADVLYTYTLAGLEQDIIWRSNLPEPAEFGLDETAKIEVYTEFINPPSPTKVGITVEPGKVQIGNDIAAEPVSEDVRLNFGTMEIGPGFAFDLDSEEEEPISVSKLWQKVDERQLLIESIPYAAAAARFQRLPKAAFLSQVKKAEMMAGMQKQERGKRLLPKLMANNVLPQKGMQMARLGTKKPGFVLDYAIMNSATNFTFLGDTTYYITKPTVLSLLTTIEPGCVIKFTNSSSSTAQLDIRGPLIANGTPYRPIVLTGRDDDSVGEIITGSTGIPIPAGYGLSGFTVSSSTTNVFDVSNLRIRYLRRAITPGTNTDFTVTHSQIGFCETVIQGSGTALSKFRNALIYDISLGAFAGTANTFVFENVTFDRCKLLRLTSSPMYMTNCLLTAVTNDTYTSGQNNATNLLGIGVYQVSGAGLRYLTNASPYCNMGTTNINQILLTDLRSRTTRPPYTISTNIVGNTTLQPWVERDWDLPDAGYHYDCLDFVMSGSVVSNNATLFLTNGVALGIDFSAGDFGLKTELGSKIVSEGYANKMNVIVRTHAVQESVNTTAGSNNVPTFAVAYPGSAGMAIRARFTDLPMLAGPYYHFFDQNSQGALEEFTLRDSQVRGGLIYLSPGQMYQAINWTNNLFDRVNTTLTLYAPMPVLAFNNLFREGSVTFYNSVGTNWVLKDNLFDKTTLYTYTLVSLSNDYNGFVTNFTRFGPPYSAHDVILTNSPDYQTSFAGSFYIPTNSPLINAGSRTANLAGLYHFCAVTNQVKETNSVVDIGFHFVAFNLGTGQPADQDGDGLADYLEDRNGNGTADAGETSWLLADTDGDGVNDYIELLQGRNALSGGATNDVNGVIKLQVYTPLK
jgi:hypothetical protein